MTGSGDTIFAPSTPPGRGAVAIVRLSGDRAIAAVETLSGPPPPARRLSRRTLRDPRTTKAIDDAMVAVFPGPGSFTGENMAELHVHGGRAVLSAVTAALAAQPGLRPADPGEFSRRAYLNEKIDLTEAEGILDLVDAETEAQRRLALDQATGRLSAAIESWRAELVGVMARLEAYIDFPDEDLPVDLATRVADGLGALERAMTAALADGSRAERVRDGVRIAILGPPNVGKSSLLNWLAKRDVAIVSDIAGTTRDVLEVHLDIDGYAVTVADTAGLRETVDSVESEGIRRALDRAESADVKLVLADAGSGVVGRTAVAGLIDADAIAVVSKADLLKSEDFQSLPEGWMAVSTTTGSGTEPLMNRLVEAVARQVERGGDIALTRLRHRAAVQDSAGFVASARVGLEQSQPIELVAEDLRSAATALGRLVGRVGVEELLDQIFAEFCLGK